MVEGAGRSKLAALDIEEPDHLVRYLRATGRLAADEQVRVQRLTGGVSNRTVLVERRGGEPWVLKQALARLRVEVDWFSDPERIHREAEGLRWLAGLLPPGSTPRLVFEDRDHHVLAMEAVPQPHENWKAMLLDGRLDAAHVRQFGALLGTLHRRASERDAAVREAFADRSFFESLRLEPFYAYAAEQVREAAPFLRGLIEETRACRLTLVHGDYSPKNILVREDRLILLDHEVIHFGDPAFDLGFSIAHLLSKAHHLPARRAAFAAAALVHWQAYLDALGAVPWRGGLEARAVRHAIACLLARVAGRSKLEYLDVGEKERQKSAAITLAAQPPATVGDLVGRFLASL